VIAGNQRGVWWNPEQSGWALAVDRNDRGVTFASWITYDEQGRPTWYVMPDGEAIGPNIVEGNVFHPVGPEFASTFTAASARLGEPVGKFRIEWTHIDQSLDADRNDERGVFTFDVKGVKGTTPIRRFLYQERSRAKVCSDFRGMYWNPGESGWGIVFEGGGSVYDCPLFAAWLTYEGAEGRPTWFVMPNSKLYDEFFPRTHRGSLYRPTGPSLSSVFDPKQVKLGDPVGSLVVDTTIPATLVGNGFQALYYTGFYPVSFRVTMNGLNGAAIQKKIRPMRFEF